jgi:NAD(P) transhydrogenase subunit alpha
MYSKNIQTYLLHLGKKGTIELNAEDEITRDTLVTRDGEVVQARVRELMGLAPLAPATPPASAGETPAAPAS